MEPFLSAQDVQFPIDPAGCQESKKMATGAVGVVRLGGLPVMANFNAEGWYDTINLNVFQTNACHF